MTKFLKRTRIPINSNSPMAKVSLNIRKSVVISHQWLNSLNHASSFLIRSNLIENYYHCWFSLPYLQSYYTCARDEWTENYIYSSVGHWTVWVLTSKIEIFVITWKTRLRNDTRFQNRSHASNNIYQVWRWYMLDEIECFRIQVGTL